MIDSLHADGPSATGMTANGVSKAATAAALEPDGEWDTRRFRMNVIVDTAEPGFADNAWIGKHLTIGAGPSFDVAIPTPRCVMTNLALDDLPRNPRILKATATHNRLDILGIGLYPCLGAYAVPGTPGTIRTGDEDRLAPAEARVLTPDA